MNLFIQNLRDVLSSAALRALELECAAPRQFQARAKILQESESYDEVLIVMSGWAARQGMLSDGRRQIAALFLPGESLGFESLFNIANRFEVIALTSCLVTSIQRDIISDLVRDNPSIGAALLRLSLAGNAVASQWAISLGRRSAVERCAHLLCELSWRLPRAQNTALKSYTLPLSQDELGDILGISTVHVNRTLQTLRAQGIISFQNHALVINDRKALVDVAEFNADYLQL